MNDLHGDDSAWIEYFYELKRASRHLACDNATTIDQLRKYAKPLQQHAWTHKDAASHFYQFLKKHVRASSVSLSPSPVAPFSCFECGVGVFHECDIALHLDWHAYARLLQFLSADKIVALPHPDITRDIVLFMQYREAAIYSLHHPSTAVAPPVRATNSITISTTTTNTATCTRSNVQLIDAKHPYEVDVPRHDDVPCSVCQTDFVHIWRSSADTWRYDNAIVLDHNILLFRMNEMSGGGGVSDIQPDVLTRVIDSALQKHAGHYVHQACMDKILCTEISAEAGLGT